MGTEHPDTSNMDMFEREWRPVTPGSGANGHALMHSQPLCGRVAAAPLVAVGDSHALISPYAHTHVSELGGSSAGALTHKCQGRTW